jgi:transposase
MDAIVEHCAGLDVHKDTVVATVRTPGKGRRRHTETATFGATARQVVALGDWLAGHNVTLVGMEATGVYWKPIFYGLEDRFTCWLCNAHHLRNVPGRKTDVADSVWIAKLVEHGLVSPSFVPPPPIRRLRNLTRARKAQINERGRTIQRLDKILQDAGVKINSVASTTLGMSTRLMLNALVAGHRDPAVLADLAKGRLRAKIPALRDALDARFDDHHAAIVAQLLAHVDALDAGIATLDARVDDAIVDAGLGDLVELVCTIPGVATRTAQVLLAECGADMGVFATSAHLASWAGICPGNRESAGKRGSGHTRPGPRWLRVALTEAAHAASRTRDTYLGAHFRVIRGRRGVAKAIGAVRHDILIAFWHVVAKRTEYVDLGADWHQRRYSPEKQARRLVRQLERLGHTVTLQPADAS